MTDRDIPSDSAADVDLPDGNTLVIGLDFTFIYLIIHIWELRISLADLY